MKHRQFYFTWSLVLLFSFVSPQVFAETKTLFEGYYQVLSNKEHVGYYIQRYELDTKKKQFVSTSFLRTNKKGGNISESLKAVATETLAPVKYQYTSLQGKEAKTIDANMRKNQRGESVLQVKTNTNGKLVVTEKSLDQGTFFSTFLLYMLLQGEKGISTGTKYNFQAVAEEEARAYPGEVFIQSEENKMGLDTFKILHTFKKTQFVSYISSAGEAIMNVSPTLGVESRLVKTAEEATANMPMNKKTIELLFGSMPEGKTNHFHKKDKAKKGP